MTYLVKEIFYTLQGEGFHTGRPSVFCRFVGCNLWSGREQDRYTAVCQFCDTDFVGTDGERGGKYRSADELADTIFHLWPGETREKSKPFVVCTGGEPLLQLDAELVAALHARGFEVAVETNGTKPAPEGVDWICVSPKAETELVLTRGNELKLVYLQEMALPERFVELDFEHFFLQPMDGEGLDQNTRDVVTYCKEHPQWKCSIQMHKILGLK